MTGVANTSAGTSDIFAGTSDIFAGTSDISAGTGESDRQPTGSDDRRPGAGRLDRARLAQALVRPGGLWSDVRVVTETGSTNADVIEAAARGADEGLVLIAENQVAGRGRLGRSWLAPPGTALTMSVLVRPQSIPATGLGWLPLLAGVAVVEACGSVATAVEAALKWPNDLLVRPAGPGDGDGWGKCGGILAEAAGPTAIAVGIGINVHQGRDELPTPADPLAYPPTSLALAGARCDREQLAVALLRRLADWYRRWHDAAGDPERSGLAAAYRATCRTLGQEVTVTLPGGGALRGTAIDVDRDGCLVVRTANGERRLAAGDVHHVRGH
jgi:birA, biotin-[acetyl-CoA-carboxylase] ligase region